MFSIFKGLGTTLSNSFLITVYSKGNWYTRMSSSMDFSIFSPISFHLNLLKLKHVCLHPCIFATKQQQLETVELFSKAQAPLMSFVVCHVMNASLPPSCHQCHRWFWKDMESSLKSPTWYRLDFQ